MLLLSDMKAPKKIYKQSAISHKQPSASFWSHHSHSGVVPFLSHIWLYATSSPNDLRPGATGLSATTSDGGAEATTINSAQELSIVILSVNTIRLQETCLDI
jgi:hypothetical protein